MLGEDKFLHEGASCCMEVDKVDCQVKCVLWASVLPLLGKVPQLKWAVSATGTVGLMLLTLEERTGCHECSGLWRCHDVGRLEDAATLAGLRMQRRLWA